MTRVQDRLYGLLPAVYRSRDRETGEVLRALLGLIQQQVDMVEQDIEQLYDNWFIETCADWVVPYIGDLLGYKALDDDGQPGASGTRCDGTATRLLVPRRDVANTIRNRRRKGTASLLADMATGVTDWPCRVLECGRFVVGTQSVKHLRLDRGRTAEVRDAVAMGRIGTFEDTTAHGVDLRRPQSRFSRGRYSTTSVAVFVWPLPTFKVTKMAACPAGGAGRYAFNALGNDCRLFATSDSSSMPRGVPALPQAFTRAGLADAQGHVDAVHYGEQRSLAVWRRRGGTLSLVPRSEIVLADLSRWRFAAREGVVAIDPELGRLMLAEDESDGSHRDALSVSYHYGFGAAMGGGEYHRTANLPPVGAKLYAVGPDCEFATLEQAIAAWDAEKPPTAVIELTANAVESISKPLHLRSDQNLEIRASAGVRPLLRFSGLAHGAAFEIHAQPGSSLTLEGLLIHRHGLQFSGAVRQFALRHCTVVPAHDVWPSLRLDRMRGRFVIDHCIVGAISVVAVESRQDPVELVIGDSIVDPVSENHRCIGAPNRQSAWVRLTVLRSTLLGHAQVDGLERAEDSIFDGGLKVDRQEHGCMRFCYVRPGSHTPERYCCQPDLAREDGLARRLSNVEARTRPAFRSRTYGSASYCQLTADCPIEISEGAQDGSEMGAFHDVYQRRRLANLQSRLEDHVPAGCDVGIFNASQDAVS